MHYMACRVGTSEAIRGRIELPPIRVIMVVNQKIILKIEKN